jgi:hypothetical protein
VVIRTEAAKAFAKMRSLFSLQPGQNFEEVFEAEVRRFSAATKDMSANKLLLLVNDPAAA